MHGYIARIAEDAVKKALQRAPVVALLGPRQCGKSTLAKEYLKNSDFVYLDLQDRMDLAVLNEPELFFERHREQIVCLDEIQRVPDFFSVLRSEIDRKRSPGRFLILGSASRDLVRQANETLAGRIAYLDLTPFLRSEVDQVCNWQDHWLRGGFPDSLLANDDDSFAWRLDFIRTFLERDIPSLGFFMPAPVLERLWRLLAHFHGQVVNYSKIAEAVDISVPTLKKYLAILEQTYMIRLLSPCETNLKKRLIKSPKVYIRDSGILHALLDIETYDQLLGHPVCGASWEGYALENILVENSRWRPSYIRTSNGAEIDLVLERGDRQVPFEFKVSKAPKASRGFFEIIDNLKAPKAWLVAPVDRMYDYKKGVTVGNIDVISLDEFAG